ncbi:MAG: VanZ family protein [Gemmatimonadales bacterium]|nr:VanZ family protein [Gemmatimonadales bacterium]
MALKPRSRWGLPLTLASLAVIGWFTLRPSPVDAEAASRLPWTCLYPCDDYGLRDAVLNVALFVPLGLGLAGLLRPWHAFLLALLTTVAVEFTQYQWLIGRDPSLRDILTNALGGAGGIWLAGRWRHVVLPAPRLAQGLMSAAAALWLATTAATATLLQPDLPTTVYWGQWAPELGQFAPWEGTVLSATVAGTPLPSGRLQNSGSIRTLLLQDSVLVEALVVAGPPSRDFAPIVSVFDSDQREIFVLGQRRADYFFRMRTGLNAIELGELTALLPDAPIAREGDTLRIRGGVVHGAWYVAVEADSGLVERWVPFEAGLLWAGLVPYHPVLGPLAALWSGLWLGALLFPAGYWAGRARVPGLVVAVGGVAGLWLISVTAGLATPPAAEWLGTAAGGLAGAGFGRWSLERGGRASPATLH